MPKIDYFFIFFFVLQHYRYNKVKLLWAKYAKFNKMRQRQDISRHVAESIYLYWLISTKNIYEAKRSVSVVLSLPQRQFAFTMKKFALE